jgi:hypothetical protein
MILSVRRIDLIAALSTLMMHITPPLLEIGRVHPYGKLLKDRSFNVHPSISLAATDPFAMKPLAECMNEIMTGGME